MKEKKILDALNEIDNEFIEEAMPQEQKAKSKTNYKWLAVAASLILVVGIGTTAYRFYSNNSNNIVEGNGITKKTEKTETEEKVTILCETTEIVTEIITDEPQIENGYTENADTWKNSSINQKYSNVDYNNFSYFSLTKINKSNIENKIKDTTVIGYDGWNGEKHTTEATLYEIKNTSSYCAIAVKFKEDENYFVYANRDCEFETLGELMEEFNFEKNMNITRGYYKEKDIAVIEYNKVNKSDITDLLYKNKDLKPVEEPTDVILLDDLSFNIEIKSITGEYGYIIGITKRGYLSINIFHTQHLYYIGKENAEKFINSFTKNNKGKRLVTTTEKAEVYNGAIAEDTVIVTEVISNGYQP